MYAQLCEALAAQLPELAPPKGESKPMSFQRLLLNHCQDQFEGTLEARQVGAGDICPYTCTETSRQAAKGQAADRGVVDHCCRSASQVCCCLAAAFRQKLVSIAAGSKHCAAQTGLTKSPQPLWLRVLPGWTARSRGQPAACGMPARGPSPTMQFEPPG